MNHVNYDTIKYPFRKAVEEMACTDQLESLHDGEDFKKRFTWDTEQSTPFHKNVYSKVRGSTFIELYKSFVAEYIKPLFSDDKIVYQAIPTFRVHYPENICVQSWHRDRDYNHNPKEVNVFMPFTAAFDTNAFWYEDGDDFSPMESDYGTVILWDGANLLHGNKTNATGVTRVSCDFRVMNMSDYEEPEIARARTVNSGTKMTIGVYYEVM